MATQGLSLHQELELMVDLVGQPPLEALLTVTKHAADVYRLNDKIGTVEPGKLADLVVLGADPLTNIRNTRTVERVFKDGKEIDTKYHADYQNPVPLTVPEDTAHLVSSPVIEELSPKVLPQGNTPGRFTIKGAGYIRSSTVNVAGVSVVPKFVNSFELEVEVPVSLLQRASALPVTVVNLPGPTGTIYGPGLSYLRHLGARDEKSNTQYLIVGF
jgi:hypothetical protein